MKFKFGDVIKFSSTPYVSKFSKVRFKVIEGGLRKVIVPEGIYVKDALFTGLNGFVLDKWTVRDVLKVLKSGGTNGRRNDENMDT